MTAYSFDWQEETSTHLRKSHTVSLCPGTFSSSACNFPQHSTIGQYPGAACQTSPRMCFGNRVSKRSRAIVIGPEEGLDKKRNGSVHIFSQHRLTMFLDVLE